MKLFLIPVILLSVSLNAIAQIFLKKSTEMLSQSGIALILECFKNLYLWLGLVCYGLSVLVWIFVLSRVNVSLAYPFLSFGFVLSVFLAYWFFGEPITFYKVCGIIFICLGLILLSLSRG